MREEFFRDSAPAAGGCARPSLITGGSQGSRTLNRGGARKLAAVPAGRDAGAHRAPDRPRGRSSTCGRSSPNPGSKAKSCLSSRTCRRPSPRRTWWCAAPAPGAVSELAAAGKPSVLVPFPFAADDHQTRNAEAMERRRRRAPGARRRDERREAVCAGIGADSAAPGNAGAHGRGGAAVRQDRARRGARPTFWRRRRAISIDSGALAETIR